MATTDLRKPKGILHARQGEQKFHVARHLPPLDMRWCIERSFLITWDLRGQPPYVSETLPYPCVNLIVERDEARIWGVGTGRYSRLLDGTGWAFGLKFKPGGFYPFVRWPVSRLLNSSIAIDEVFGSDGAALVSAIRAADNEGAMVALAEQFIAARLPEPDEMVAEINRMIDCVIADRTITKVEQIAARFNVSKRTLQRLFNQYVGVSPKWVIQRYRLHEAADLLERGVGTDWAKLALELGYFDQAHFINDFKATIGKSPGEYAKQNGI
jgi:AraC-like DNA-binding protein